MLVLLQIGDMGVNEKFIPIHVYVLLTWVIFQTFVYYRSYKAIDSYSLLSYRPHAKAWYDRLPFLIIQSVHYILRNSLFTSHRLYVIDKCTD